MDLDDFDAFLDSLATPIAVKSSSDNDNEEKGRDADKNVKTNLFQNGGGGGDMDFLEWLGEDEDSQNYHESSNNVVIDEDDDIDDEGFSLNVELVGDKKKSASSKLLKKPMNIPISSSLKQKSNGKVISNINSYNNNNAIASSQTTSSGHNNLSNLSKDEILHRLIDVCLSSFPDVPLLKEIRSFGYIKDELRGRIWSILLTGSFAEDMEAKTFDGTGHISDQQMTVIMDDCKLMVGKVTDIDGTDYDQDKCMKNMFDILVLYCARRNTEYHHLFCHILSPLLVTATSLPRSIAYSCFYSLCSNFIPLINLPPDVCSEAMRLLSFNIRLLLSYHNPCLALHLDRVLPGWCNFSQNFSLERAEKEAVDLRCSVEIDELEKAFGLDISGERDTLPSSSASSVSTTKRDSKTIDSARSNRNRNRSISGEDGKSTNGSNISGDVEEGCIPLHWICAIFSSSVPPSVTRLLWDWAILNNDPYSGVYLTVSLLNLFGNALLSMSGGEIKLWFESAAVGQTNWYNALDISNDKSYPSISDWKAFTSGWQQVSSRLKETTPTSFIQQIVDTEKKALANVIGMKSQNDVEKNAKSEQKSNIMDSMRKMSLKLSSMLIPDNPGKFDSMEVTAASSSMKATKTDATPSASLSTTFVIDEIPKYQFACMLTQSTEVVSCLCAAMKGKRFSTEASVAEVFLKGVQSTEGYHFRRLQNEQSLYFGIDCRSETEKMSGRFPKAYSVDPSFLDDPDAIDLLLETLQPLSQSVHICIIGSGNKGIEQRVVEEYKAKRDAQPLSEKVSDFMTTLSSYSEKLRAEIKAAILRKIQDDSARLDGIAMFFMKRGFSRVSILEGGFYSALTYLMNGPCRPGIGIPLSSMLVDVDELNLQKLLGIGLKPSSSLVVEKQNEDGATTTNNNTTSKRINAMFSNLTNTLENSFMPGKNDNGNGNYSNKNSDGNGSVGSFTQSFEKFKQGLSVKVKSASTSTSNGFNNSNINVAKESEELSSSSNSVNREYPLLDPPDATSFVIDADDDSITDNSSEPPSPRNASNSMDIDILTPQTPLTKSAREKDAALASHKISGLGHGDVLMISRASLPDSILYHARIYTPTEENLIECNEIINPKDENDSSLHRFLCVTSDRLLVLDSGGKGEGNIAKVDANHHLTRLEKLTFRKREPDVINIFMKDSDIAYSFRVKKKERFIESLKTKMKKFDM